MTPTQAENEFREELSATLENYDEDYASTYEELLVKNREAALILIGNDAHEVVGRYVGKKENLDNLFKHALQVGIIGLLESGWSDNEIFAVITEEANRVQGSDEDEEDGPPTFEIVDGLILGSSYIDEVAEEEEDPEEADESGEEDQEEDDSTHIEEEDAEIVDDDKQ